MSWLSLTIISHKTKKFIKKILPILLFGVIVLRMGIYIWHNQYSFIHKFEFEAHQNAYLGSTYVIKGGAPIPDHIVYGYAAWKYIHGKNPTLINPEMPPLGKYLMGISILLFKRIEIGSLVFGIFSLILVFLIGKIVLKSTILALIPVVILSFEPLFIGQLDTALLDIYHLFFILLAFYFFILAQRKNLFFIPASLALGGVMAVKFYAAGIIVAFSWGLYLIIIRNYRGLINLIVSLPLAILVLMASYFKIFLEGENLRRFFGIQKWMWDFHSQGKFLVPPGSIWQLIFLKKWITWWADRRPLPAPDWQITWPITTIISLTMGALALLKKKRWPSEANILLIWVIVYLASLSFGVVYPRYLLPLLPFMYILSILALKMIKYR